MHYFFKHIYLSLLLILLLFTMLTSCNQKKSQQELLDKINLLIKHDPDSAISLLSNISLDFQSPDENNYYLLLQTKAQDKALIKIESDSIIKTVIQYFSKNKRDPRYIEALYYGGRVASNIGNSPLALKYFHEVLDRTVSDSQMRELRGNTLSQTARILSRLRLYDDAAKYLAQVIQMEREDNDTTNLIYDLQQLASLYIRINKFDKADQLLQQSLALGPDENWEATAKAYRANIKYEKGDLDSAYILIKGTPQTISNTNRFLATTFAAEIYLKLNKLDTAYMYAMELAHAKESRNIKTGYELLTTTPLRNFLPKDSIDVYYLRNAKFNQEFVTQNKSEQALLQQTLFNYKSYKEASTNDSNSKLRAQRIAWIIGIFLIGCLCVISIMIIRHRKRLSKLQTEIHNLKLLNTELEKSNNKPRRTKTNKTAKKIEHQSERQAANIKKLRKELELQYVELANKAKDMPALPKAITQSNVYLELCSLLKENKVIPVNSDIKDRLERMVIENFQDFKRNLSLLFGDRLKEDIYLTCLLIKCRFSAANIAQLSSRGRSSISKRQDTLKKHLDNPEIDNKTLNKIIQLL